MIWPSSPVPKVSPYLIVEDTDALIEFMAICFDAEELDRQHRSDGSIAAASVRIGHSVIMMAEGSAESGTDRLHVYVEDVNATYEQALAAGADSLTPPEDAPEGGLRAGVRGPSGTQWWFSTDPTST